MPELEPQSKFEIHLKRHVGGVRSELYIPVTREFYDLAPISEWRDVADDAGGGWSCSGLVRHRDTADVFNV